MSVPANLHYEGFLSDGISERTQVDRELRPYGVASNIRKIQWQTPVEPLTEFTVNRISC